MPLGPAGAREGAPSTSEGQVPAAALRAGWGGRESSRGGVEAAEALAQLVPALPAACDFPGSFLESWGGGGWHGMNGFPWL